MQQFQSKARLRALGQVALACSVLELACGQPDEKSDDDEAVAETATTLFDPPAERPREADCSNGDDDDGDGNVDCGDLGCLAEDSKCSTVLLR